MKNEIEKLVKRLYPNYKHVLHYNEDWMSLVIQDHSEIYYDNTIGFKYSIFRKPGLNNICRESEISEFSLFMYLLKELELLIKSNN